MKKGIRTEVIQNTSDENKEKNHPKVIKSTKKYEIANRKINQVRPKEQKSKKWYEEGHNNDRSYKK